MAQLENGAQGTRISSSPQQQTSTPSTRPPLDLHVLDFQQGSANEGKEATVHDFLSLGGSKSTSSSKGLASSVTTQDLLQPLEKNIKPSTTSLLSHGLAIGAGRPHTPAAEYVASQQNSYNLANGTLDLPPNVRYKSEGLAEGMKEKLENLAQWSNIQSKYRPSEIGYTSKALLTQGLPPISKQWQYQQQAGLDLSDATKRTSRIPSEDDEDDEDEALDHAYNPKRESYYQKSDITQKPEGKNNDLKGATPRSKHSATEQRRRSKINDRFQTLRQLLPNVDQKRDKASFLLEVIEYIQMLQEKVKKFETAEQGRQQERAKSNSWDASVMQRNSGCRDSTANTSYLPLVTAVTFDSKEVPESNGFAKNQSSPLRVTCEHEGAGSDFTPGMGPVLALQNRMSQGPQACSSSYESKVAASKPMPITQPAFDRISAPVFSSVSQATSEAHAIFGHLLKQEEQPAGEAKGSLDHKVEVGSFPLLQVSNQRHMGPDESVELLRPSQALDIRKTESPLKESEKDESRQILGADGSLPGPKSQLQVNQHEPPIIQGGVINISSMYSQGLLDTITRALQSSGVDLTQATISVQIDLGKPGGDAGSSRQMARLGTGFSQFSNQETGSSPDSEQRRKKPKLEADA